MLESKCTDLEVKYGKARQILDAQKSLVSTLRTSKDGGDEFSREMINQSLLKVDIEAPKFKNQSFNPLDTLEHQSDSKYQRICAKLVEIVDEYCSKRAIKQVGQYGRDVYCIIGTKII